MAASRAWNCSGPRLHEPTGFLCTRPPSRRASALRVRLRSPATDAASADAARHGSTACRPVRARDVMGSCFARRGAVPGCRIRLPGASYFDSLSGKLRYDIRRARASGEAIGPVTFEALAPSPSRFDSCLRSSWPSKRPDGKAVSVRPWLQTQPYVRSFASTANALRKDTLADVPAADRRTRLRGTDGGRSVSAALDAEDRIRRGHGPLLSGVAADG